MYYLLNENKIVDTLPIHPDVSKVEKRVRTSPYTEFYFRWHGTQLQRVSIYDRKGERKVIDFTRASALGHTPYAIQDAIYRSKGGESAGYAPPTNPKWYFFRDEERQQWERESNFGRHQVPTQPQSVQRG